MDGPIPLKHVTLLLGAGLLIVVILVVLVYILHRAFRKARSGESLEAPTPRAENEAAFAAATVQAAIAHLKQQEKHLQERLREAQRRAEASERTLSALFQEISAAVLLFNSEGVLVQASAAARTLLRLDTWSRRRYPELLAGSPDLAEMVRACLEDGKPRRKPGLAYAIPEGAVLSVAAAVSACAAREGAIEGVVLILEAAGEPLDNGTTP